MAAAAPLSTREDLAPESAVKCRIFTQQAAMTFELARDRNGNACINVEAAAKRGEAYDWGNKLLFQISTEEAIKVVAVLMGLSEKVMLTHPNSKRLGLRFNADGSLYLRLEKAGETGALYNLQAPPSKAFGVANVCMAALQVEYAYLDSIMLRDLIRGAALRTARGASSEG